MLPTIFLIELMTKEYATRRLLLTFLLYEERQDRGLFHLEYRQKKEQRPAMRKRLSLNSKYPPETLVKASR